MNVSKYADNLKIYIGAKLYGGIVDYSIKRELSGENTALPNQKQYLITVKRVCREKTYENVDPFDQYTVDFVIERLGKKASFYNCNVNWVLEELGDNNEILQTVNLTATTRNSE